MFEINDLYNKVNVMENHINGLFSLLNCIDIYVRDNCYNTHFIEPLFCQLNTNNIILNNNVNSNYCINIKTDFSKFINLTKLDLSCYNYNCTLNIKNLTLKHLIMSTGYYNNYYSSIIPNILEIPNLIYLEFIDCSILHGEDNLVSQLQQHPNKENIILT